MTATVPVLMAPTIEQLEEGAYLSWAGRLYEITFVLKAPDGTPLIVELHDASFPLGTAGGAREEDAVDLLKGWHLVRSPRKGPDPRSVTLAALEREHGDDMTVVKDTRATGPFINALAKRPATSEDLVVRYTGRLHLIAQDGRIGTIGLRGVAEWQESPA